MAVICMNAPKNNEDELYKDVKRQADAIQAAARKSGSCDGERAAAAGFEPSGADGLDAAKQATKRKRGKSRGRIRREQKLAIARSITNEQVKAKMRPFRGGGDAAPRLMHTYESAEMELLRQGKKGIIKAWVTVAEDKLGQTVLKHLAEGYAPPEGAPDHEIKIWPCPAYFVGDKHEIYPIPPEDESAEEWLPDRLFDEVVERSPKDFLGFIPPIRRLCNALAFFVPPDEFTPDDQSQNGKHSSEQSRSPMEEDLVRSLKSLGLLDYDLYYGTSDEYPDRADDYVESLSQNSFRDGMFGKYPDRVVGYVRSLYQDSFRDSREAIDINDPRSLWCKLTILKGRDDSEHLDKSKVMAALDGLRDNILKIADEREVRGATESAELLDMIYGLRYGILNVECSEVMDAIYYLRDSIRKFLPGSEELDGFLETIFKFTEDREVIDDLRGSIQKLAYEAYMAGREAHRLEILDSRGGDLITGADINNGRPKKDEKIKDNTKAFRAAAEAFEGTRGEKATPAKVRDYIEESGNENWIRHLNETNWEAFRKEIGRYDTLFPSPE